MPVNTHSKSPANSRQGRVAPYSRRDLRLTDIPDLIRIVYMLARITVMQKLVSVPRLVSGFDSVRTVPANSAIDVERILWLTRGVLRRFFSGRYCMKRSLILFHFLRKAGWDARIVFGVFRHDGNLEGHAWVTVDGRPFAEEGPVDQYAVTYAHPR